jgi:hypothetical protein
VAPLEERDASNNDYWGSRVTLGPDLTFGALSARIDPERRQLVVAESVKNAGAYGAATPVVIDYSLLPEGGVATAALPLGRQELAGGLAPGAEQKAERAFAVPDGLTAGRYRLVGQIDPLQRTTDSRRDNNQRQSDWIVVGYDLSIDELAAEPSPDGLELRVTDTVRNRGLLPTTGRVTIDYSLRQDEKTAVPLGRRVIENGLSPGERSAGGAALRLPEGSSHYRWKIAAAASAAGVDTQPGNNAATGAAMVNEGVDLAVGRARAAISPAGDRLSVTETVTNDGWIGLGRPVRVIYALSVSGQLDGQALMLGDRTIAALPAGGDATTTTTWPLPASLEPRRYFVIIQVDPDRRVAEVRRDNNLAAGSSVTVGPQPVLEGLKAQLKPDGAAMAVTVTVANQGNRTMTAPLPVTFSVARDEKGRERVMELGRNTIMPLSPGSRATPAFTLSLPASLGAGAYFVTAQLEGAPEEQLAVSPAALAIGPDLASRTLRAELIGQGEQLQVRVTDEIINLGNRAAAGPFVVSYLLSTDWRLDRSDLLLGRRRIEQLPAGEAQQATLQFAVPVLTIETGRYFVLSRIDLDGTIEESNRANNLRPTVEGLLIERLEKKKGPDLPDVISAPPQTSAIP